MKPKMQFSSHREESNNSKRNKVILIDFINNSGSVAGITSSVSSILRSVSVVFMILP